MLPKAYPYVVTEFAPNVGWAGKYNTINCASGHHMAEAAWMRNTTVFDSYTTWWNSPDARHNYYYWWATSLKRNFDKTGNVTLLKVNNGIISRAHLLLPHCAF